MAPLREGTRWTPEPFMSLEMCVFYGQRDYLRARDDGAPEEILENIHDFVVMAADMLAKQSAANVNTVPVGSPAAGGLTEPMAGVAPIGPPPALAAPAMNLQAA